MTGTSCKSFRLPAPNYRIALNFLLLNGFKSLCLAKFTADSCRCGFPVGLAADRKVSRLLKVFA